MPRSRLSEDDRVTFEVRSWSFGQRRNLDTLWWYEFAVPPTRRGTSRFCVRRLDPAAEGSMTFGYYQPPTAEAATGEYRFNGSRLEHRLPLFGALNHLSRTGSRTSFPDRVAVRQ